MLRLRTGVPTTLLLLAALQGAAAACDLTGHWRSTLGALDLLQTPYEPASDATLSELQEPGARTPGEPRVLLSGGFDKAKGRGQLAGLVDGTKVTFRWAAPESFAAPTEAGDVEAAVSAACDSIEGKLRNGYEGAFDQVFVARRVAASAADAAEGHAAATAALEARLAASRTQHEAIDRSLFDPAALAERLGGDPERLLAFVRDAIADEPYQGVLRGAEGTLIAGAGNAADKALLLAALLRAHGHAVRFAGAHLTAALAAPLLAVAPARQRLENRSPPPGASLLQAYDLTPEALRAAERSASEATAALLLAVMREADDELAFLDEQLAGSALPEPGDPLPSLQQAVAEHWWVQVETAQGWRDLDPTPLGAAGGVAAEQTLAQLPGALYHRVEIMVFIESSDGSSLAASRIGGWSLAAADVMDAGLPSFRLLNLPVDGGAGLSAEWRADQLGQAAQGLAVDWYLDAANFQPVLLLSNGETQVGQAFDLSGELLPDDWQLRLAHNLQRNLGGGLESAGGILEGLLGGGQPPAQRRLTAQWYEFRLIAPDGSSRSHLRTVFDRLGPARRAAGVAELPADAASDEAVRLALATSSELLITGGPIGADFAFWRMEESFLANAPFLQNLLDLRFGRISFSPALLADAVRYPNELLVFDGFRQAVVAAVEAASGVELVQAGPNLLMLQRGVHRASEETLQAVHRFDLIEVGLMGLAVQADAKAGLGQAQRRYGLAVTALERLLLPVLLARECPGCALGPGLGTTAVFDRARQLDLDFVVLGPGDAAQVAALPLPDNSKSHLTGELAAGRWLVLPRGTVELEGDQMLGWWRIDPESGATLGMMQSGAGEGITEYIVVLSFILFGGNIMAVTSTVVLSPFDEKDQGLFGVLACAFVAAICPSRFGFNVPADQSAADVWSCSVEGVVAGIDCARLGAGASGTSASAPVPAHECQSCGHSLPPR